MEAAALGDAAKLLPEETVRAVVFVRKENFDLKKRSVLVGFVCGVRLADEETQTWLRCHCFVNCRNPPEIKGRRGEKKENTELFETKDKEEKKKKENTDRALSGLTL